MMAARDRPFSERPARSADAVFINGPDFGACARMFRPLLVNRGLEPFWQRRDPLWSPQLAGAAAAVGSNGRSRSGRLDLSLPGCLLRCNLIQMTSYHGGDHAAEGLPKATPTPRMLICCLVKAEGKMATIIALLWTSGEKVLAVGFGLSALALLLVVFAR